MAKKIIYIVLGALLVFGILFLIWTWFFSDKSKPAQTGTFGTASSTQSSGSTASNQNTNGIAPLDNNTTNGVVSLNNPSNNTGFSSNGTENSGGGLGSGGSNNTGGTGSGGGNANGGVGSGTTSVIFTTAPSGTDWLVNAGSGSIGGGSTFSPTPINQVTGGNVSGSVSIPGTGVSGGGGSNGLGLGDALLGAGLIGAISCTAQQFAIGGSFVVGGGLTGVGSLTGVPVSDAATHYALGVSVAQSTAVQERSFLGCITNVIAKAALAQITASTVNWINSGFNGKPSFITNYQQFFTNVADLAAGQFIQSSGLAFLCSPFQLQIKIAIAQSYANRNAQSCSLSKVINNINSFMNGNFSQGGWGGLVSFTTVPTNNPYGAFAYAQVGLATAQSNALQNSRNGISPNGFLAVQQLNCNGQTTYSIASGGGQSQAALASGAVPSGCKASITTPGTVIESSLASTLDTPLKQLGLANDLDQIINALLNQLMTRTLYGGLSNLSGQSGYQSNFQTPDQVAAQTQAQASLSDMQNNVTIAQQYGSILQGSINDIENAQTNLSSLVNCWSTAASSSALSSDKQTQAANSAATAQATLLSLNAQITPYNNGITQTNQEIVQLQTFETQALAVSSTADAQTLATSYAAAKAATAFISPADVTTAQQNRVTLQSQMNTRNNATQAGLTQCNAFGQ